MITFHCTQDAKAFFSVTRSGKSVSPVDTPGKEELAASKQQPGRVPLAHWQVHAFTIKRKYVLIAMEQHCRYAMVFADLKKGDWQGFLALFFERWFNHMIWQGQQLQLWHDDAHQPLLDSLMQRYGEYRFITGTDRSIQAHINQIKRNFEYTDFNGGLLPNNREQAADFDAWANSMPRNDKASNGYFHPDERMMLSWMAQICNADEKHQQQVQMLMEDIRRARIQGAFNNHQE